MPKIRLDVLLMERGLAESRSKAHALIMAGQVRVNDQVALKPSTAIDSKSTLTVDHGFTDCMLQRGATKVYAIDVGKGILHWKLRNYARVIVMEETNARHVESLPEKVSFVTVDASFISLKILLPVTKNWLTENAQLLCLIKPQFEAGKKDVARGDGVIRDPEIHRQVLLDVLAFAKQEGFGLLGLIKSPLLGPKGNTEFLVWLDLHLEGKSVEDLVNQVIPEVESLSGE